jgi:hypothetical protein
MAKNTIFAGGISDVDRALVEEAKSGVSILPGSFMLRTAGLFTNVTVNGEGGAMYIADLNTMKQGGTEDAWVTGDSVKGFYPRAGEQYNVRSAVANYTAVDTPLTVNALGQVRPALTDGTEEVIAYVQEIINVTVAGTLVRVRMANFGRAS